MSNSLTLTDKRNMALRKKFRFKIRCFMILAFVILLYVGVRYIFFEISVDVPVNKKEIKVKKNLANVIVHIDFKGSPVTLSYLVSLLPTLKNLGATGLLLEYEDMFPYEDRLVNLSARNCYNKKELKEFLTKAVESGFDIIPLVQTFGHMEHALKLAEFQHLREIQFFPDSICPSKLESRLLITDMLSQVILFHMKIFPLKYFHIGCDEVYHINKCRQCKNLGLTNVEIFSEHIKFVRSTLNEFTTNTVALMWDDMLRQIPVNSWDHVDPQGLAPVCWDYAPRLSVSHVNMMKYHKKFKDIWIASAYKGADGRISSFPDLLKRLSNHYEWMKLTFDYKFGGEKHSYAFKGIILTGWSRYSHMDPPCDLLQVALPSLYLNLLLVKWTSSINDDNILYQDVNYIFTNYIQEDFMAILNCDELINLEYLDDQMCSCSGGQVCLAVQQCDRIVTDIQNNYDDIDKGLMAVNFYSEYHYINMNLVASHVTWCNNTFQDLVKAESYLKESLAVYYDNYFVDEYVNFKLYNTKVLLKSLFESLEKVLQIKIWNRKPESKAGVEKRIKS